jgi:imidazolonepropionase-like amidohydrolase
VGVTALHLRGVLLPGDDERDLWVVDGLLSYRRVAGADTVLRSGWVLPGLVDAHCHVGIGPDGPLGDRAGMERQALADRLAGALLLRDCGSPVDSRWMDDRRDLPSIVRCGRHLARSKRYLRGLAIEVEPDELAAAAAEQADRSDGWVKLVGDWIDRSVGDLAPSFPPEAVAAAIEAAHDRGARVTAHVFGREALGPLLAAGIDCIEHGTGLGEDEIALMARRRVALVPTLVNVDNFPSIAEAARARFGVYSSHMDELHGFAYSRVRAAYEAGVPIFAGTDAGGGVRHGRIADEVRALHAAGLPAEEALGAACWRAREWLGQPGLGEGDPADLVVYDRDPRADLDVLAEPVLTVLRGSVVGSAAGDR